MYSHRLTNKGWLWQEAKGIHGMALVPLTTGYILSVCHSHTEASTYVWECHCVCVCCVTKLHNVLLWAWNSPYCFPYRKSTLINWRIFHVDIYEPGTKHGQCFPTSYCVSSHWDCFEKCTDADKRSLSWWQPVYRQRWKTSIFPPLRYKYFSHFSIFNTHSSNKHGEPISINDLSYGREWMVTSGPQIQLDLQYALSIINQDTQSCCLPPSLTQTCTIKLVRSNPQYKKTKSKRSKMHSNTKDWDVERWYRPQGVISGCGHSSRGSQRLDWQTLASPPHNDSQLCYSHCLC